MDLLLPLDVEAPTPLHRQVYDGIRSAILTGRLHPGDQLPPTRVLAEQLSVSRQTITEAYDQLQAEGYVQGKPGSGTYVAPDLPDDALRMSPGNATATAGLREARLSAWGARVGALGSPFPFRDEPAWMQYDLRPHQVARDSFPWEAWSSAVDRALVRFREALLAPPPSQGHLALREAVARHVARYRAVNCSPEQIVIVNGSQQGVNLLALVALDTRDRVAVEDPGYPAARLALEAMGMHVVRVPVDAEGIEVEELSLRSPYRLIHVTPSHQDPTGATLSFSRRLALLEVATRDGALVIEDDYDSEFRYEGRPVESLQGLDRNGLVVYAGTFSKSVLAGLRIGFLVLPTYLVERFVAAKTLWDSGTPMLEQIALAEFMESGDFERHIRRMRRLYRERRDALLAALSVGFGDRAAVGPRHGGLNVLVQLDVAGSAESVAQRAAEAGIALRPATRYYAHPPELPTFLVGFGALNEAGISEAVQRLAEVTEATTPRRAGLLAR